MVYIQASPSRELIHGQDAGANKQPSLLFLERQGKPSGHGPVLFYPKDMDRTRFSCKTRGCNASITTTENGSGEIVVRVKGKHNHPNHAQRYKISTTSSGFGKKSRRLKQVRVDKTVVSSVRNETLTCRRKSADYRLDVGFG